MRAGENQMDRVTYCRKGDAVVVVDSPGVELVYGQPPNWQHGRWSMSAEAFDQLRAANPNVDFVEDCQNLA